MFLRVKDGIVNLNAVQFIRRTQDTITIYFEGDYEGNYYDVAFDTEDEAIDYLCGLSSLINAKKLEV